MELLLKEILERLKNLEENQKDLAINQKNLESDQKEGFGSVTARLDSLDMKVDKLNDSVKSHLIENINSDNIILNEVYTKVASIEKSLIQTNTMLRL